MFTLTPSDAIDFAALRRVLVIKLRHHGDVLLTSPVFSCLRSVAPEAEIDALVYADTSPMLANHPAIARIHGIDRQWKRQGVLAQARAEWQLLQDLRARRYDLLVHLTEHPRGAWLARWLRPRWSVARKMADGNRLWRSSFTHYYALPRNAARHTVEANLDALRRLGCQPPPADRKLVLVPGPAAEQAVDALLAEHLLEPKRFLHLHPGSRWLFKTWPPERVAGLIDALADRQWRIVLTAAPDERERAMIAAVTAAAQRRDAIVDLTGRLSLQQLAALTRRARLFVGVDSAPMHIAAAVGTPTVALFGPSGELEWSPWGVPARVVTSQQHPCRPCGLDGCGGGKASDCLVMISVERMLAEIEALLAATA